MIDNNRDDGDEVDDDDDDVEPVALTDDNLYPGQQMHNEYAQQKPPVDQRRTPQRAGLKKVDPTKGSQGAMAKLSQNQLQKSQIPQVSA